MKIEIEMSRARPTQESIEENGGPPTLRLEANPEDTFFRLQTMLLTLIPLSKQHIKDDSLKRCLNFGAVKVLRHLILVRFAALQDCFI